MSRTHGGVAIYVRNDIPCTVLLSLSNSVCETLIVKLQSMNTVVCLFYRPPSTTYHQFSEVFDKAAQILVDHKDNDLIVLGDWNFPSIDWSNPECRKVNSCPPDEHAQIEKLLKHSDELFLSQLITFPTRGKNTLDLVFTNITSSLLNCDTTKAKSTQSDHDLIEIMLSHKSEVEETHSPHKGKILNFHKADFVKIKEELSEIDWTDQLNTLSVKDQYLKFLDLVNDICKKHTPVKSGKQSTRTPFYKNRRALMRRRRRRILALNKTLCQTRILNLYNELSEIDNEIIASHKAEKCDYEAKAIEKISTNPKYFYSYARKSQKRSEKIGPFINSKTKSLITEPTVLAEMLQEQYCSVFTKPSEEHEIPNISELFDNYDESSPTLSDLSFTKEDIVKSIAEIKANSAPGPDGFSALLLRECATQLSDPLFIIFRNSIDSGEVPNELKDAFITPIHKGGLKSEPKNYRPVSLLSHILKTLEKIIRRKIVKFLEDNNCMNPCQHGFCKYRSCLSQLLEHYDQIIEAVIDNKNFDVVYLDFFKAFDVVVHNILLKKVKKCGIVGKVGKWLHAFLTDRNQTVFANGMKSRPSKVSSGVPQGSVLGPVLFLIMIADINESVKQSTTRLFADDSKVGKEILTEKDGEDLQSDLNSVYKWGEDNSMRFNTLKFQSIRYGNNEDLTKLVYTSPDGTPIPAEDHIKDLGVIMSRDLTFNKHIETAATKCRQLMGWIFRTFITRESAPMMTIFKSLVLPRIDYCSQLYFSNKHLEAELEGLQRSYTARMSDMKDLDYWSRLISLRLYSIQRRNERYSIIYTWKILEGLAPNLSVNTIKSVYNERRGRLCVIPNLPRSICSSKLRTIREKSFGVSGPQLFNLLPKKVRNISDVSVDTFKHNVDMFLRSIPDQPSVPGYVAQRAAATNSLRDMVPYAERDLYGGCAHRP